MKNTLADFNFFYSFFRPAVDYGTFNHYRNVAVRGRENIPWGSRIIFAPCHQNALMDALLILLLTRRPVAFLARADIFSNPTVASFLNFLRISPVYRIRDGRDQLGKNEEVFDNARQVLLKGMPLCLMAEGRHNDRHQLLPLVKGMFRIAGETQRRLGDEPLYIVPVGFDYDEYQQSYSNICINIGKPIAVSDYMDTYLTNEPVALNQMRDALGQALRAQMHHCSEKERYDDEYAYTHSATPDALRRLHLPNTPWGRFQARQDVSRQLADLSPEEREPLLDQGRAYRERLERCGVPLWFASKQFGFGRAALSLIAVVATLWLILPIWRWWLLSNLIVYLPTNPIMRRLIKDTQFRSSVNYGVRLFLSFFYIVIAAIVTLFTTGPAMALAMLILGALSAHVTPRIMVLLRDVYYFLKLR